MALRIRLTPALPLIPLLPGLSLLGVLFVLLRDGHGGGFALLQQFAAGAVQPSVDPIVLGSLLNGLQITLVIAVMSWGISSLLGVGLGLLSSNTFWKILAGVRWPAVVLRRWLAPLRAVHELIWGLLLLQVFGLNGWVAVCAIAIPYTVLMARVIADQVDCHVSPAIPVLKGAGATPWAVMLTGLVPPLTKPISDHIGHRLDCALRSALILGVFGLGGLGTDLSLSLRSLQFQEMWSGLWLLAITMVVLDRLLRTLRCWSPVLIFPVVIASPGLALGWGTQLDLQLAMPVAVWPVESWSTVVWNLIEGSEGINAALEISWPGVIGATVWITLIAACIATGLPPLLMLIWPSHTSLHLQGLVWGALRLIPAPLTALLLLMLAKPSMALAGLALGLHHSGVMGRVLMDDIRSTGLRSGQTMKACGASPRVSWLYGPLADVSRAYLTYATYRLDVILRDTAIIGMVGGAGLGWQLMEALSSFHWWLVLWIVLISAVLTLLGETLGERLQGIWNSRAMAL